MAKHAAFERPPGDMAKHPAIVAWKQLRPGGAAFRTAITLKRKPKSMVCRLMSANPEGPHVIAKRCRRLTGGVERTVYEEILPYLPITTVNLYGLVDDPDTDYIWLFLEDGGVVHYSPLVEEHRALAGRYIGLMHATASQIPAAASLPDRGPGHQLEVLRKARAAIQHNLANPALRTDDLTLLERVVALCDVLERNWTELEVICNSTPRTLVHGDLVAKNMCVRGDSDKVVLLLLDWENAGWGVPAVDLAQSPLSFKLSASLDIDAYWSVVRDFWPGVHRDTMRSLNSCGIVFRCLASIHWDSFLFTYDRLPKVMGRIGVYHREMLGAMRAIGWNL